MAGAKLTPTRWPGIYRRGERYAYEWTDAHGKRRRGSARTLEEARTAKSRSEHDARHGNSSVNAREPFAEYATAWVDRYQGRGRQGFRETTRADYRRDLEKYAIRYFGTRLRLVEITPRHIAEYVAWLCNETEQGRVLADATVRRILSPVRACLATAVREGVIAHNPAVGAALPHRPAFDGDDEEDVKALTAEQLETFLAIVNPRYRLLFELLAATGLRISEALALQWRHVRLDGDRPCARVRRAHVRGTMGPPKSRHGRRDVPLGPELVQGLRRARAGTEWPSDDDLVFGTPRGTIVNQSNLRRDALVPAAQEAGVPWAGFHTFRHTTASMLFARGGNAKQVQRWLGHHSPAFTLATYVHLLDDELGEPLMLERPRAAVRPDPATSSAH